MKKTLTLIFLIAMMSTTACSRTQVGWVATNIGDTFEASYQCFDGQEVETHQLESGESFSLSYEIEVDKGSLTLELVDPEDQLVWEESFSEDAEDVFEFTPETSGRYRLRVIGDDTQGGFVLNW
jgi:hypothetical protein